MAGGRGGGRRRAIPYIAFSVLVCAEFEGRTWSTSPSCQYLIDRTSRKGAACHTWSSICGTRCTLPQRPQTYVLQEGCVWEARGPQVSKEHDLVLQCVQSSFRITFVVLVCPTSSSSFFSPGLLCFNTYVYTIQGRPTLRQYVHGGVISCSIRHCLQGKRGVCRGAKGVGSRADMM